MTRDAETAGRRRVHAASQSALLVLLALCARASASLGAADSWRRLEGPPALSWPRDHGSHPEFQTEWWYATGDLVDPEGRAFGYQLTIFRRGLDPTPRAAGASKLRATEMLAAHFVLVDVAKRDFRSRQRLRRAGVGLAAAEPGDLAVWIEDWEMRRSPAGDLALRAHDGELGLDLVLSSTKPLVLHGEAGFSRKGPESGNASAYVSSTRLATRGSIKFGERTLDVRGESWFDHEWGTTALAADVVGWDWFGLRLADGRELMIYRLRRNDGGAIEASSGTLVDRDGTTVHLTGVDFDVTPLETWTSPASGGAYPARWRIELGGASLELEVRARVAACEVDGRASTGVIYWEGPVVVSGSVSGSGYAELTGYAAPLPRGL